MIELEYPNSLSTLSSSSSGNSKTKLFLSLELIVTLTVFESSIKDGRSWLKYRASLSNWTRMRKRIVFFPSFPVILAGSAPWVRETVIQTPFVNNIFNCLKRTFAFGKYHPQFIIFYTCSVEIVYAGSSLQMPFKLNQPIFVFHDSSLVNKNGQGVHLDRFISDISVTCFFCHLHT